MLTSYLFATNVQRLNRRRNNAYERDLLLHLHASPNKSATEPPHVVPAQVLVLKNELNIVRAELLWIYLERVHRHEA